MSKLIFFLLLVLPSFSSSDSTNIILDNHALKGVNVIKQIIQDYDTGLPSVTSAGCVAQLKLFLGNLFNSTGDDFWALRMIDATGKMPSGIIELNVAWVGSYEECLQINSPLSGVQGKYCLATITVDETSLGTVGTTFGLPSQIEQLKIYQALKSAPVTTAMQLPLLPSLGICIPNKCSDVEVQNALHSAISIIPWNVTCQTKKELEAPLDTGAILTLSYFGVFLGLVAISTMYDLMARRNNGVPHPLLASFSVYTNGKKIFRISKSNDEFSCLHGLRFFSLLWVIYGHNLYMYSNGPVTNIGDVVKFVLQDTLGMTVFNAHLSVDTFFVITGMLVVYGYLKAHQRFNIFIFYLHRYLRLVPAVIPVILTTLFLIKYLSSGPFYPQIDGMVVQLCRKGWGSAILFFQNYRDIAVCVSQLWYLDIDWQMYVISPLFLLWLPKRPGIGITVMVLGIIGGMAASYWITWDKELPTSTGNLFGGILDFQKYYYIKTHTRCPAWLIGGILGYLLAKLKKEDSLFYLKIPRWLIGSVWAIVLIAIPVIVFAGKDNLRGMDYHPYSSAFWNAFARPAWAVCIAWIIFACSFGYGGVINKILSWSYFQVFNRFSYSIYITHLTLLYVIFFSQRQPLYFSIFTLAYTFWGIFMFSTILSVFWTLTFESPTIAIESYFLRGGKKKHLQDRILETNDKASPSNP